MVKTTEIIIQIIKMKWKLTDKSFDAQWLYLHVDEQSAVGFHQRGGQGHAGFSMGQLDHTSGDAVDQTEGREEEFEYYRRC